MYTNTYVHMYTWALKMEGLPFPFFIFIYLYFKLITRPHKLLALNTYSVWIKFYFTLLYCQYDLFCKSLHVSLLTQLTAIWKSSCLFTYSETYGRSYLVLFNEFVSAAFIVNIPGIMVKQTYPVAERSGPTCCLYFDK